MERNLNLFAHSISINCSIFKYLRQENKYQSQYLFCASSNDPVLSFLAKMLHPNPSPRILVHLYVYFIINGFIKEKWKPHGTFNRNRKHYTCTHTFTLFFCLLSMHLYYFNDTNIVYFFQNNL